MKPTTVCSSPKSLPVEPSGMAGRQRSFSCAATAYVSLMKSPGGEAPAQAQPEDEEDEEGEAPGAKQLLTWLTLSAMGSCMLLAVSSHITQNIASVPFLWVLPLGLYLVTFILAFDQEMFTWRPFDFAFRLIAAINAEAIGAPHCSMGSG